MMNMCSKVSVELTRFRKAKRLREEPAEGTEEGISKETEEEAMLKVMLIRVPQTPQRRGHKVREGIQTEEGDRTHREAKSRRGRDRSPTDLYRSFAREAAKTSKADGRWPKVSQRLARKVSRIEWSM